MRRDQLNQEQIRATLELLNEVFGLDDLEAIRDARDYGEARASVGQRQKAVNQIVSDFQTARSEFDTAVSDYSAASTTVDRMASVTAAVQAQQAQIDEIVEYLVLTEESL